MKKSIDLSRICKKCNKKIIYTNYSNFRRAIRRDTVCKRCCVNRGKFVKEGSLKSYWTIKEALVLNSGCAPHIVRKLFMNVCKTICKNCGNSGIWNNKPLTLHLDHINGNNKDHRRENLRWLCPNCHQQTDTWGRKI